MTKAFSHPHEHFYKQHQQVYFHLRQCNIIGCAIIKSLVPSIKQIFSAWLSMSCKLQSIDFLFVFHASNVIHRTIKRRLKHRTIRCFFVRKTLVMGNEAYRHTRSTLKSVKWKNRQAKSIDVKIDEKSKIAYTLLSSVRFFKT